MTEILFVLFAMTTTAVKCLSRVITKQRKTNIKNILYYTTCFSCDGSSDVVSFIGTQFDLGVSRLASEYIQM